MEEYDSDFSSGLDTQTRWLSKDVLKRDFLDI